MLTARAFDEDTLFQIAYDWENSTKWRVLPDLGERPANLPPLDVEQFNTVQRAVGQRGFDEVLKTGNKFDLSTSRMLKVVKDEMAARNIDWWTE
jgi:hypothetical protein